MRRYLYIFIVCVPYSLASAAGDEKYNSGWRINTDNDLLTGQTTDRDYTGGLALTLSGRRAQEYPVSIDGWRAAIDGLIRFPHLYRSNETMSFHSQQYGMTLFTPEDIQSLAPVYDDRPYASLFFMSNSEVTVLAGEGIAYVSRLTIGFLGLDAAEDVQSFLHALTDSDVPNGWQNQISSGGEPTALLSYSMQNNLVSTQRHQLKAEYEANLGFVTDVCRCKLALGTDQFAMVGIQSVSVEIHTTIDASIFRRV